MNYLAHFHLSHGDDDLLVGALLGDYVKGPLSGQLPEGLEQGVMLHRRIDAFTDRHSELRAALALFEPRFRRYGGIMLDIACDHFLSQHWQQYHHQPLDQFNRQVYQLIDRHPALPSAARQQAERLIRYDVLGSFDDWRTVEAALARVGQRLQRDNPLAEAAPQLEQHYHQLETLFEEFYPQLMDHCEAVRRQFRR